MKFSLIVATINRYAELFELMTSLNEVKEEFEFIIVDQNQEGYLDFLEKDIWNFKIIHKISFEKGLSRNRNIGKELAQGDVICFPDDDCRFYPDTLSNVKAALSENVDVIIGQIYDRVAGRVVLKKWPQIKMNVNLLNLYIVSSSITIFCRKDSVVKFDEKMGAGERFGSCEDVDFLYRLLNDNKKITYNPTIQIWHPEADFAKIDVEKVSSYTRGFGYFIRKSRSFVLYHLVLLMVLKKLYQYVLSLLRIQAYPANYFSKFYFGFICGFFRR